MEWSGEIVVELAYLYCGDLRGIAYTAGELNKDLPNLILINTENSLHN